ncbi:MULTISPECIES: EamA family transporter [Rhodomicrobium]|uniref:EamA family transporter n=1 Tax=Rhodomicrobium TaxID=1068 RepID=UPI000B4B8887|nr:MULTISPECIES: EamA family transporter [Rhodomicrobium]
MSPTLLALILATVTASACAQLALKLGMSSPGVKAAMQEGGAAAMLLAVAGSPLVWIGLMIYGLSVVVWLWVLSKVDLSLAYPFVGVSFIMVMLFGVFLLNEQVTPLRLVGTVLIAVGCVLVARS